MFSGHTMWVLKREKPKMDDVEREICHEIVCFCEIGADYKKYDIIQYSIE